jgi:hypothetical protein
MPAPLKFPIAAIIAYLYILINYLPNTFIMSCLTCLAIKLATGKVTVPISSFFRNVGSHHVLPKVLPDNPQGKKCAMRIGSNISVAEVIMVPFRSLPRNFGIQPLPAKTLCLKKQQQSQT